MAKKQMFMVDYQYLNVKILLILLLKQELVVMKLIHLISSNRISILLAMDFMHLMSHFQSLLIRYGYHSIFTRSVLQQKRKMKMNQYLVSEEFQHQNV